MKFILYASILLLPLSSLCEVNGHKILNHYLKVHPVNTWDYDWTTAIFLYGAKSFMKPQFIREAHSILLKKAPVIITPDLASMSLTEDPQMRLLTKRFFDTEPLNEIGTIDHVGKRHALNFLVPSSIWADSMMMYILNGLRNFPEKKEFFLNQIYIFDRFLKDKKTGLYKHSYHIKSQSLYPQGVSWGRGNMWMSLGMIEILGDLDQKDPHHQKIKDLFIQHVDSLVRYADSDRGLHTLIEDKDSYLESSATALLAYVLLKGRRLNLLDSTYEKVSRDMTTAAEGFLRVINEQEISVEGISGPTTAFKYPFYYKYLVRPRSNESYGVGAFLLLSAELQRR